MSFQGQHYDQGQIDPKYEALKKVHARNTTMSTLLTKKQEEYETRLVPEKLTTRSQKSHSQQTPHLVYHLQRRLNY